MVEISPASLLPAAVVPQCLDNQYVSDAVLNRMVRNGSDFNDANVKALRRREIHREFIRSMIYSQQVVVNRAFLINNPFFHEFFDEKAKAARIAFDELVSEKAIVPFLGVEKSLVPESFDVHLAGYDAVSDLESRLGNKLTVVRLSLDEKANRSAVELLAHKFAWPLMGYATLSDESIEVMFGELTRGRQESTETVSGFKSALRRLSDFSRSRAIELADEKKQFSRNEVYKKYFVRKDASVANGAFSIARRPYTRALKKLVDLRYNVVLPDALNRFTFAPSGMPSRVALQDTFNPDNCADLNDYLESINRSAVVQIFESQQQDMVLPDFGKLGLEDVVRIRALEEWNAFAEAQSKLVADPMNAITNLLTFQEALLAFQQAMHRLSETSISDRIKTKCVARISIALRFGSLLIPILDNHNPDVDFAWRLTKSAWDSLPSTTREMSVELLVNVIDIDKNERNESHSYQLQNIRSQREYRVSDVRAAIEELQRANELRVIGANPLGEQARA